MEEVNKDDSDIIISNFDMVKLDTEAEHILGDDSKSTASRPEKMKKKKKAKLPPTGRKKTETASNQQEKEQDKKLAATSNLDGETDDKGVAEVSVGATEDTSSITNSLLTETRVHELVNTQGLTLDEKLAEIASLFEAKK